MIVQSNDAVQLTIQLTHQEIVLLANALDEVFELGFEDDEFHARLGGTRLEANILHEQIIAACDALQP
jgi:hypothetical protein